MNLDTLINQLELATKIAMNGDCHASVAEESGDVWLGFGAEWMVGPNGAEMLIDEAQAIAIRHNTSPDVLQALLDLRTHRHWHEEAIKLQGPEPGRTPSMVNAWIRILMSRLDASETRVKELARELELMHDIAISHSGRVEELTKEVTTLNDTLLENGEAAS